jgi:hypothetical protein
LQYGCEQQQEEQLGAALRFQGIDFRGKTGRRSSWMRV